MSTSRPATIMAGIPQTNMSLYRRIRFLVGDPVAIIEIPREGGTRKSTLIIRDIEMDRAKKHARADEVICPTDTAPASGLSGDRETATAQSVTEFLKRNKVSKVVADRTLPLIFASIIRQAGIEVECDVEMGVLSRRSKDEQEIEMLRQAQHATEEAMEMACRTIARARPGKGGLLSHDGATLTAERVRSMISTFLMERGYFNPPSIVACGSQGGDCHDHGHGELFADQAIIVDIFPRNQSTLYNGDCTRTVVNGTPSAELVRMHKAVVEAKAAAIAATRAGRTGEDVHRATMDSLKKHGFERGLPKADSPETYTSMQHGTGHGVGLDVHEPPLLDMGAPVLVAGDALTIEPGLYSRAYGGVRVEDMVIVTRDGCINLNTLPEGLDWK